MPKTTNEPVSVAGDVQPQPETGKAPQAKAAQVAPPREATGFGATVTAVEQKEGPHGYLITSPGSPSITDAAKDLEAAQDGSDVQKEAAARTFRQALADNDTALSREAAGLDDAALAGFAKDHA